MQTSQMDVNAHVGRASKRESKGFLYVCAGPSASATRTICARTTRAQIAYKQESERASAR